MSELSDAQALLAAYKAAELAVLTGQSYRIGSRELTRADLNQIRQGKKEAQADVDRLTGARKMRRVIPRDI